MIILVLGYNASGKSTLTEKYTKDGFHRVNRDEIGGKLDNLPTIVEDLHKKGTKKFVLDNTYADVESRKSIIACAKKLKLPIKCVWLDTSFEDAQFNACQRMIRKVGKLMGPEDFKTCKDPNLFPPVALFAYKKRFERPTTAEGFTDVEKVPFVRKKDPKYSNKALILDYDDTLRKTKSGNQYPLKPDDVEILPGRKEKLAEYVKKGYILLGVSNQSGVAKKKLTKEDAEACFKRTNELLGFDIEYHFCPHSVPPLCCYCRKPSVGNYVLLAEKHKLSAEDSIFVGDMTTDKTFASRCGLKYYHPNEFFK